MSKLRKHLTYGNVMSTLALFMLLAGGTAIAAQQLGKKTVGAKQLKSNAVTTAKIKKAAVTKAKIKDGAIDNAKLADNAVTGAKIADGSVGGADINAAGTSFSQITHRIRANTAAPFAPAAVYPIGSYTQSPGEDNQILGSMDVQFAAGCAPPRVVTALILLNAANPAAPEPKDYFGYFVYEDKFGGEAVRRIDYGPFPGLSAAFNKTSPASPTQYNFTGYLLGGECKGGGSGINVVGAAIDVIGTK